VGWLEKFEDKSCEAPTAFLPQRSTKIAEKFSLKSTKTAAIPRTAQNDRELSVYIRVIRGKNDLSFLAPIVN
jgi:hypothetical protein